MVYEQYERSKRERERESIPFGKVFCVFVQGVVAAEDVDQGQQDLIWCVVQVDDYPANAFVSAAEVYLVEDLSKVSYW